MGEMHIGEGVGWGTGLPCFSRHSYSPNTINKFTNLCVCVNINTGVDEMGLLRIKRHSCHSGVMSCLCEIDIREIHYLNNF